MKDAAWYYPEPKEKAQNIKDHVAFCEEIHLPCFCENICSCRFPDKSKVDISTT